MKPNHLPNLRGTKKGQEPGSVCNFEFVRIDINRIII